MNERIITTLVSLDKHTHTHTHKVGAKLWSPHLERKAPDAKEYV